MPWERGAGRPSTGGEPGTSPPRPARGRGGCAGCLTGCGCLLALLALLAAGIYLAWVNMPSLGTGTLNVLVNSAIDGKITVNGERVRVPSAWQKPWRATAAAYGRAYDTGAVAPDHFRGTLWETFLTCLGEGGELPDEQIRSLCERMRDALSTEQQAELPPFPPLPALGRATESASPPGSPPQPTLEASERDRQYEVRRALVAILSRLHGPAEAKRLVPADAIVYDFQYNTAPYPSLMDDWEIAGAAGSGMEPGMQSRGGFSAAPSMYLAAPAGAQDAEAAIRFTTLAGTLRFWYRFEGAAGPGSALTVYVDDAVGFVDSWPTTPDPSPLARNVWVRVDLENLAKGRPKRIAIHTTVVSAPQACFLYIDDFVFAP